ncbi:hypothetical protein DQQ10_00430 [Pseudochryseolinea flava]|uniref:Uncharacterized protein n=2 Tax=Pseudochryseolinea flava TaxID=2059302 RepID=A0A364Y692_9BACT|nr:hypothetical protein DQQ10_00430 [Pseudochryseolinea flava]
MPIVTKAVADIEKHMWPQWLPWYVCNLIHWLATGNSVVRIKYRWAFNLRQRLTKGQMITDIKEKYATLRIYGSFCSEIDEIIKQAVRACNETCQECGCKGAVDRVYAGWVYNLCARCSRKISDDE